MTYPPYRLCLLSATTIALTACSVSDSQQEQKQSLTQQEFSAEDKRVASVLSIRDQTANRSVTPQYTAALCSLALAAIGDRLAESDLMSSEEIKGLKQAQDLYRRRATAGQSAQEREKIRSDIEAAHPEPSDRAQFAIGCLRDLV